MHLLRVQVRMRMGAVTTLHWVVVGMTTTMMIRVKRAESIAMMTTTTMIKEVKKTRRITVMMTTMTTRMGGTDPAFL